MTFLPHGVWRLGLIVFLVSTPSLMAAPANKAAVERDVERFPSYRWRPFEPVQRPGVPGTGDSRWGQNPIDAFVAAERSARKLRPGPDVF